ncbi:MAG: hypothetical protein Q9214_004739, partial [Letrouitia sp. 1 TL-2023]
MLPPSMIQWLLEQPEDTLSAKRAQVDAVEAPITMLKPEVALNPVHEEIVRRQLKVHLGALTENILDEIQVCIHELCESNTQEDGWTKVNLDFVLRRTITRASNRAFIGLPICRDTQYIENAIRYVDAVCTTGLILKLVSFSPKQLFTRLLTLKTSYHYSQCAKYLRPLFEKITAAWQTDPDCLPNNFAGWLVEQAMKRDDKLEQSSDMLARRAMALNFAAVHTTTLTTVNLILDLATSPKEPNDIGK